MIVIVIYFCLDFLFDLFLPQFFSPLAKFFTRAEVSRCFGRWDFALSS